MMCKIPILVMAFVAPGKPGFNPVEVPMKKIEEAAKVDQGAASLLEFLKSDGPHEHCRKTKKGDCATHFLITPGEVFAKCETLPLAEEKKTPPTKSN